MADALTSPWYSGILYVFFDALRDWAEKRLSTSPVRKVRTPYPAIHGKAIAANSRLPISFIFHKGYRDGTVSQRPYRGRRQFRLKAGNDDCARVKRDGVRDHNPDGQPSGAKNSYPVQGIAAE